MDNNLIDPNADSTIDRSDPKALINLVPEALAKCIQRLPQDVLDLTADELYNILFRQEEDQSASLNRMRIAFWCEFNRAQATGKKIAMGAVYAGVTTSDSFYRIIARNPHKLMWILTPPTDYHAATEELLLLGLDEMRAIMRTPIKNPVTGEVDSRLAAVKTKIFEIVDNRVKGAVIQRIDQRSVNVNVNADKKPISPPANMGEIDRRLQELEKVTSQTLQPGQFEQPKEKDDIIEGELVPNS